MIKNQWVIVGVVVACLVVFYLIVNQENRQKVTIKSILPGIEDFVNSHPEYGSITETKDMPDWAYGKRQLVITNKYNYLFYLYGNEVTGIWKYTSNGGREQIFHKDIPELPKNVHRESTEELTAYIIIYQVDMGVSRGKAGSILITSYSKSTPKEVREKTLRKIAEKEGFTQADLYCTMEAYKANYSESFLKKHPNALKDGFLGRVREDGTFFSE